MRCRHRVHGNGSLLALELVHGADGDGIRSSNTAFERVGDADHLRVERRDDADVIVLQLM